MKIGYFLSSEEWGPRELVELAAKAQDAGFEGLWISDHFHPWNDEQGHSPFVWSVIGGIARATHGMKLTTAVTCPTVRIHPAVVAQAAATSALLLDGNFCLGVGSGEALNEHILGDRWPSADVRLEMLEEAVQVLRLLWQGGFQDHCGRHYRLENARIYDLPEAPPPVLISGFGPKSIDLAARVGDGYCTVQPDADAVARFRSQGGNDKIVQGGMKACWGGDEDSAKRTAYRLWPNEALPGELAQVLPTTRHFEQASGLVTPEMVAEQVPCGPDIERHVEAIDAFAQAGFDELYIQQIGPDQDGFFDAYREQVLPRVREPAGV
ncbi:MAG: LLM class F420-dependent oxidoreductase [Solirubrobacterales bacterium]|nr:LLM class F420-dependent oxidoreductase [Solirubrobacterales bacterium]